MRAEDIRAFVQRPREPLASLKAEYWAERTRTSGGADNVAVGEALFLHAREVDPAFPSAELRAADLQHHLRLKALIDRVAPTFSRR